MLVQLKQAPDSAAQSVGLDRYNRSVMPNTFQSFQPYCRNGRWWTGLDEDDPDLRKGDPKEYELRKQTIKEEREALEKLTGLDLRATSTYWETYRVIFKGNLTLDLENPADKIRYHVLVRNNFAAPNPDAMSDPEYVNVKYAFSRTGEEESNKAKIKKEKNRAIAELTKIEENKNRLLILGKFIFGNQISEDITTDSLYNLLSDFIEGDKKGADIRKFIAATERTTEELQVKITVDEAERYKVIRLREGNYQRGNITLGRSIPEVVKYLSNIENSHELSSIMEEVREKKLQG